MNRYRQLIPMALLVAAVAATTACASDTKTLRDPIRPVSDCLNLGHSAEVYTPNNKTIAVKTGPKYYRVDLVTNCGTLNAATLDFKVADDKRGLRRMCGELGDQIINGDGMHCNVKSVSVIDKQQFRQMEAQSKAR